MEFSKSKKDSSCKHDEYCDLSKTACVETDFKEHCKMKDSDIEDMPLLKKVKESVERTKKRKLEESK